MDKELYFVCADNVNVNGNFHNFIFTIKYTKLYVPVVTLAARDNKKLSKDLKDQFVGMNLKEKVRIKIGQVNIDIFRIKLC